MVLECLLPARTGINRFMPPQAIFVRVDHRGRDLSDEEIYLTDDLEKGDAFRLLDKEPVIESLIPQMIKVIEQKAQEKAESISSKILNEVDEYF